MGAGWFVGGDVPALLLSGGIAAGALFGWIVGPGRGPVLLARIALRAALLVLVALLAATLLPSGFLALAARASLAVALGFLCGGLTQTLATAMSAKGARGGGGQRRALGLASLLCLSLWALALLAVFILLPG